MEVGTLVGLWRYPVKSMGAEALEQEEIGFYGVAGDRRWAFIQPGLERSGFPWMTLRERADMRQFIPRFVDPQRPEDSVTMVVSPAGEEYDVVDPALSQLLGEGVRVLKREVGLFDAMPLSLISVGTLRALGEMTGRELEPQRFRPNLLIDLGDDDPGFTEDSWAGRIVRIGELEMRVDLRDPRCVIVTMDVQSGERDPNVLRQIAQRREGCAGVYGSAVTPARVAVGATVSLD